MTKAEKTATIEALKETFSENDFFYVTDASGLSVAEVNEFRRLCFEKGISMKVVKNTLVKKALESAPAEKNYQKIIDIMKGPSALLFTDTANAPARILKDFRENKEKPLLKAAYIDTSVYEGDDMIDTLSKLKSKEELLGDVIGLLQSPAKNVISALQSGGQTLSGLLKTLSERGEA